MTINELIEKLEDIEGTAGDAYSCCPEGDIGTDTSDTMYYINHVQDELEKLIIELGNDKEVWKYKLSKVWNNESA